MLGAIAACLLLTSIFAVIPAFSVQPPLDTSSYYVGTIGQPVRIDPARAYDTTSGELLQNVYQTLIWWDDKNPVTFTPGVGYNLTTADYSDLNSYVGVVATENPTTGNGRLIINSTGSYWHFTINPLAKFQNWTGYNGAAHIARAITAQDVVWSFRRQIIYDSPYSPDWMWMTPAFGIPSWRDAYGGLYPTYSNGTFSGVSAAANEIAAGKKIEEWCWAVGNDVYFHFEQPWAEGVLRQIFAQTWGGIVNPDWAMEYGAYDGSNLQVAGWTNKWHFKPTSTRSELDTYKDPAIYGAAGAKYSYANWTRGAVGSGPYEFTSWDSTNKIVRIDRDPAYWKGWANAGNKGGVPGVSYFNTVIWRGIDAWPTRKMLFLEGEFDVAVIPRANMYDVLTSTYNPIAGINLIYNVASLSNDVMLFGMNIAGASPYQAFIGYPTHIGGAQPYFFNDTHMRRAFAWSLNYTSYIQDAWSGEGIVQRSWWVDGLSPQSYKNTNASMPQRNLDTTQMQNELNLAVIDGNVVGTVGFDVTLVYNIGNDQRLIACNMIRQAFLALNPKYHVNVVGVDWPAFLDAEWNYYLPMYDVGWLADFADPDNFCEPYQASWGAFMWSQGPPFPTDQTFVDTEIQNALVEPNFNTRGAMYQDLQYRYWLDVPSFPLIQPVGRRFARDWVQGWYYNSLFPGLYAYDLYKSAPTTYQPVDVDVIEITPIIAYPNVYISMGQMKQLYGGGALATMTFQVRVKRNDANTNVTLLTIAVGLERFNLTALSAAVPVVNPSTPAYPASTIVLLAPGEEWTGMLTWYEDGMASTCQANATWEIGAFVAVVAPTAAEDDNTANNFADAGFSSTALTSWNVTTGAYYLIPGDINGDGIVNILDSIAFMNCFGKSSGQLGYNQAADLYGDGIVDILDAILLAIHLGQKIGSDP